MKQTLNGPVVRIGPGDSSPPDETGENWMEHAAAELLRKKMSDSRTVGQWLEGMDYRPIQVGILRFADHVDALGWCLANHEDRVGVGMVLRAVCSEMEKQFSQTCFDIVVKQAEKAFRAAVADDFLGRREL